jgi:hypothetical protein
MVTDLHDSKQAARERERLRFQISREWRSRQRWDFSEAEISAEIEHRLEEITARRVAVRQLELPLAECESRLGYGTKTSSCRNTRAKRIGVRGRIVDLLTEAGSNGRTREELATLLGMKDGSVCAAVRYLLAIGDAAEPFTRPSRCGQSVAVVVLKAFASEANS